MSEPPPPPFDTFARYLARARRGEIQRDPSDDDARRAIAVRTFAGPAVYTEQLAHVRVAHLTDLHVGRVTPMRVQRAAIALANEARPDFIALTGDFVCHSQDYLDALTELLSALEAPAFAVLGNHDHWSGADEVRIALRRARVCVLDNAHTEITVRGQRVQVVGLDDAYTGHADRERAVRGLRADLPAVGLSHIAEEADGLWRAGVPLVLAGHTHAGQVTVARLHEIAIGKLAGHKYVHGLYGARARDANPGGAVYVGAGIGSAVVPLRLGERAKREVTVFELGLEPGAVPEHHGEQPPLSGRKPSPELVAKRHAAVARKRDKRERKRS